MFYTPAGGSGVPRRAVPERAQPRQGHGLPLVAEPVHGLRAPLHVLLRPRLRAPRRPARPTSATGARSASRSTSPRCCARELARPSWEGETVAIGAATDPYQPAEGRYKLTRACLEALRDASNPFSLITRSPMIVRDLDVLVEAAKRAEVGDRLLGADARRGRLAAHRARHAAAAAPPRCGSAARRRGDQGGRRNGTDPSGHLRPAGPARAGRPRRARGRRDEHLGERPLPEARHARALPRGAGPRLAGGAASATSSSTGTAPTSPGSSASPSARWSRSCARSTESATAAGSSCGRNPGRSSCMLLPE